MAGPMRANDRARILIVEDDPLIGFDLAVELEHAGFAVVGVAPSVAKALTLFEQHGCDLAILDVNLGRETSAPIASMLAAAHVPFIGVTGYLVDQCPPEFSAVPLLSKPFQTTRLVAELRRQLSTQS
ncbi:putative two component-response regulator receiver (CheY-like protein) [Bradyrhizobium sp. STM 3843]|uniref:response regulator n=1 Tax=Bradyrhizobium sp. STM 3843 TaxID=551947 RepID=UPI0002404CD6|nr:response regulator [Bradyrhizobium sp. STM 3843]CCE09896.1 putative two component-response regulator receiver (CheY-like protein) [Bradyrhizobium sp. STM 3843]